MANHLIYNALHMRLLAEALADATGVTYATTPLPDPGEGENSWAFDVALDDLRDHVVPNMTGAHPTRRAKGLARLVKYLRELDRLGPSLEQAELAELVGLLDSSRAKVKAAQSTQAPQQTVASARAALCQAIEADQVDEAAALRYCIAQMGRLTQLVRPAMGALADRHYAPLPQ